MAPITQRSEDGSAVDVGERYSPGNYTSKPCISQVAVVGMMLIEI